MTKFMNTDCIHQIGETAGRVWHFLDNNEPVSISKLAKNIDVPRDTVMQAIGWLARESKVEILESNRGKLITLKKDGMSRAA